MTIMFLFKERKYQSRRPAIHALCMLFGIQLLLLQAANAQQAALANRAATFLKDSLKQWGHFTPRAANLPNVKFYCVCGPYENCKHEAQEVADRLGYRLPEYDYRKGMSRLRQKILFYFEHGEVMEIEIPYRRPFYFVDESESFCDVNLDRRIPETGKSEMPTDSEAIWDRFSDEARDKVKELGIAGKDHINAFTHIYVFAQLVREYRHLMYPDLIAFVGGTGQEFRNHWIYRDGGKEPGDPH